MSKIDEIIGGIGNIFIESPAEAPRIEHIDSRRIEIATSEAAVKHLIDTLYGPEEPDGVVPLSIFNNAPDNAPAPEAPRTQAEIVHISPSGSQIDASQGGELDIEQVRRMVTQAHDQRAA